MSPAATRPLYPSLAGRETFGVAWLAPVRVWHLLSLDAPSVAAAWLLLLHPIGAWHVRLLEASALALAVWLLYVGDRVLDASRGDGDSLQARHYFHARHVRGLGAAALCALPLLGLLVLHLPSPVRAAWLWLALPMAVYALAIHRWPVRGMPKEVLVGVMFAVATAVPALCGVGVHPVRTLAMAALFAVVCWVNCVAIARWELGALRIGGVRSTAWGARHLRSLSALLVCAGALLATRLGAAALACSLSAALLLVLDTARNRIDAVALRALADATLLTPLLFLFVRG